MSDLTQAEADHLLSLEKRPKHQGLYNLPSLGGILKIQLEGTGSAEDFHLDIQRSRIELGRGKIQNRVRTTVALARLDIGGAPHRNPDGLELPCPHLHLYREGFGDKWAFALPSYFSDSNDIVLLLSDFLRFCNVTELSFDRKDLFS